MIISNCPRCNEAFRTPSGELPEDAYAQCPWCRDTFPLTDVLNRLPPILEVFSADGQPITSTPHVATAGLDGAALRAVGTRDPIETGSLEETIASETVTDESWDQNQSTTVGDDHFDFAVEDPKDEQLSAGMAPMKVSPIPARRKKSQSSGIGKAVGIVLGGVAALPIAFGILWAMGRLPDLGFGPFNSQADSTRKAAPPTQSTARPTEPLGQPLSLSLSDDQQLSAEDDPAESAREQIMGQPQADEPVAADGNDGGQSRSPIVLPAEETQTSDAENQAGLRTPPGEESPLPSESKANRGVGEQQTASTLQVPAAQEEKSMPDLSDIPAPSPVDESAELTAAADKAGKMIEAVSTFEGPVEERTRRLLLTYQQIAMTCDLATGESDALRTLATIIRESSILKDIERSAAQWLIYSLRTSEGIALIGRPGSDGDGQGITLDSGKVVSVVGDTPLPSAEKILAMGKIVDGASAVELVLVEALP